MWPFGTSQSTAGTCALFVMLLMLYCPAQSKAQTPQKVITACSSCSPADLHAADLSGSGSADVLSAGSNGITWYENLGGDFSSSNSIGGSNRAGSVYASDLTGDGSADVIAAFVEEDRIVWYKNTGSGTFLDQKIITNEIGQPASVHAADLSGDGSIDILSAANENHEIAWYENQGDGTFSDQRVIASGIEELGDLQSVYATDLTGNGRTDVIFASNNKVAWYKNQGGGTFSDQRMISAEINSRGLYAADLSGNGNVDVLSTTLGSFESSPNVVCFENTGSGTFSDKKVITNDAVEPRSVHAADLTGNGKPDVLSASAGGFEPKIAWYENQGGGTFSTQKVITSGSNSIDGPQSVYAADLTGDGNPDALSASGGDDKIAWHENYENGFSDQKIISTAGAQGIQSIHAVDLTGNQRTDVLSASERDDKIAWYENQGGGTYSEQKVVTTEADGAHSVHAADFLGNGRADIVTASFDQIAWHENLGNGDFSEKEIIATGIDAAQVHAADVTGDESPDVIFADDFNYEIAWYENQGSGTFSAKKTIATDVFDAKSVYASDLTGNGTTDVLSASDGKVAWYENQGDGAFSDQKVISTEVEDAQQVYAADLTGNGKPDVLSASDDKVAWYENSGNGEFSTQKVLQSGSVYAESIYATDLTGDGEPDIQSASDDKIAWYENTGDGAFTDQKTVSTEVGDPKDVFAADLTGNGGVNVLSASRYENKVAWYESFGGVPTAPTELQVKAGDEQVDLIWSPGGDSSPAGYNVYRSTSSFSDISNATKLNDTLLSSEVYLDTEVTNGTEYFYRVTAVNNEGEESKLSAEVTATPLSPDVPFTTPEAGLIGVADGSSSTADVDGDGNHDLLITGVDENGNPTATLYLGNGDGSFSEANAGLTGVEFGSSSIADVNGDGHKDLLITGLDSGGSRTATLYVGNGDGTFSEAEVGITGVQYSSSSIADVNGDGHQDLLISGQEAGFDRVTKLYLGNSDGTFSEAGANLIGAIEGSNSIADVNGDGDPDLLITGDGENGSLTTTLYIGNGDGTFSEANANLTGVYLSSSSIADVNGDGNKDILINGQDTDASEPTILYLGNGDGTFSKAGADLIGGKRGSNSIADVDGDENKDLLITGEPSEEANTGRSATLYLGDGDGTFSEAVTYLTGVARSSSLIADVNNDGKKDLLITGDNPNRNPTATLYLNQSEGPSLAAPANLSASPGDGEVSLSWEPGGASNPAGYNVYRAKESFSDISEATETANVSNTSYTDTEVTNGTEYFYRVTAVDGGGNESMPSGEVSATPVPQPFIDWPGTRDPSITLRIVNPTDAEAKKVRLTDKQDETGNILSEKPLEGNFVSFNEEDLTGMNDKVVKMTIFNSSGQSVGYLPFRFTIDDLGKDVGIDAIVYVHGEGGVKGGSEGVLRPNLDRWSSRWDYYENIHNPYPLSMLIPPNGDVSRVEYKEKGPVLLVHGVSGRYPSWGNSIGKVRDLTTHLGEKGYEGWQFYYPENQDITKSGPLLAKAIHQLQKNLGYGSEQSFDLIAHSMGGLVSRHYVQKMGIGKDRNTYDEVLGEDEYPNPEETIEKFLMLGTPNHGSLSSYQCRGGTLSKCDIFQSETFLDKDPGAPAYVQMTPGSVFMRDLNRSKNASEAYSPGTTLVLAGTRNPILESNLINLEVSEIPGQDDGVVSVSSASLLDLEVPLATGDYVHSAGLDLDEDIQYDPRLNEDTYPIITSFLSDAYDPMSPASLGDITGFWGESEAGSPDPEPIYENNLSAKTDKGIITIATDDLSTAKQLGLKSPCFLEKNDSGFPESGTCVRFGFEVNPQISLTGMEKVPGETRYFSKSTVFYNFKFVPTIASGLSADTDRTVAIQDYQIRKNKWKVIDSLSLTTKNLHTTQNTLTLDEQQRSIVEAGSSTPSVGGANPTKSASATPSGSPAPKDAQTTATQFQVSAATDTLSFWLAQDSTGNFASHNMRLVTPDGSVIDSSGAKSEAGFGYSQNLGFGYAIYLVADPTPGQWTVRYDGSVNATVSAPVKGTVSLRANTPDSVFTTEESVPLSVSVSDQNSYQNALVSAQLRVEDPNDGDIETLRSIELSKSGTTTYEGEFSPSYVGSYQIAVDFSAKVQGESVLRRTTETVGVIGDSTNTPPEPPPAPSSLSAELEESESVALSWSASGSVPANGYRIYRDTIPNPAREVASVPAGQTAYTDTGVQGGQVYYYRVAAAGTGGVESKPTDGISVFTYPSSLSVSIQRSFGSASSEQGYRLIALPGAAGQPLRETLSGQSGREWQAWWDDGSSENYFQKFDGSDTFRFQAGRGFWALGKSDWSVNRSVETVPLGDGEQTSIPLHDGWNIISNPFGGDVSWAQVNAAHSDSLRALWRFTGTFAQVDTFRSATTGEAFYFLNDAGLDSLSIPYPGAPSAKRQAKKENSLLTIKARPKGADAPISAVKVGFDESAAEGLGRLDEPAPPGQFSALNLRLRVPGEVPERQRLLMTEQRPLDSGAEEGQTFQLRLRAEMDMPIEVTASGWEAIGNSEAKLLQPSAGRSYDLGDEGEPVIFEVTDSTTAFKLAVGSASYVENRAEEVAPDDVSLTSYPNPVRKQATVEYTLTEPTDVRITVYDVLGRQVATLEEGRRQAGRHTLTLDGSRLPSGVYFGRLQAGDETRTQKITIVR